MGMTFARTRSRLVVIKHIIGLEVCLCLNNVEKFKFDKNRWHKKEFFVWPWYRFWKQGWNVEWRLDIELWLTRRRRVLILFCWSFTCNYLREECFCFIVVLVKLKEWSFLQPMLLRIDCLTFKWSHVLFDARWFCVGIIMIILTLD